MCGKDAPHNIFGLSSMGSPPHVRERLQGGMNALTYLGITPACAGKTVVVPFLSLVFQDHPRMCGKDAIRWHNSQQ